MVGGEVGGDQYELKYQLLTIHQYQLSLIELKIIIQHRMSLHHHITSYTTDPNNQDQL